MAQKKNNQISRRGFIKGAAASAAVSTLAAGGCRSQKVEVSKSSPGVSPSTASVTSPATPGVTPPSAAPASGARADSATVVLVRDAGVLDGRGRVRARVLASMLDRAVCSIGGTSAPREAWKKLLRPGDRLGIKSNVWSHLRTPPSLEKAITRRARGVGIPADRIGLDDRGARVSLQDCTALINVRPLRSHHWAGVGGCIKNYVPFVSKPWTYHPDSCADLGAIWNLPIVKGKTRLNVLVMLTPLFHGRGPHHFAPEYLWKYQGLLVSTDPVAADTVGVQILKAKRRAHFGKEVPFQTRTKHIEVADRRHHIGVSDPLRIEVRQLGWKDGLLLSGG